MHIVIVGAGYVGLVTGACFAEVGHKVTIIDIDSSKINLLKLGEVPFHEPGLKDMLERNIRELRLEFDTKLSPAILDAQIVFIAVGTPQKANGAADVSQVFKVAKDIGKYITDKAPIIVNKSTSPIGTAKKIEEIIQSESTYPVTVISNPEFLKEGAAIDDFMKPDRVIVGTNDAAVRKVMSDLYAPFVRTGNLIMFMDRASAEMTKYAANCFLAARISLINEIAGLCDASGADVEMVRLGIGSDKRIGPAFLFPGVGFGGSCFPKDIRALIQIGKQYKIDTKMLQAIKSVNDKQKYYLLRQIETYFEESINNKVFAIWGLSFKPNTDDLRDSPAVAIIYELLRRYEVSINVYDPVAMNSAKKIFIFDDQIRYCNSSYECCKGADALIVMTEWSEFRQPDFERIKKLLKQPVVFDGRNIYDPVNMLRLGFAHFTIGRNSVYTKN